mmetsp:Transcript_17596/g.30586  ORF Transcript_17596/g.30586 Transcript_17596/m.30586 type:complete len:110 (+) Transcript_17596:116-445(+)|eukprot:CAMPEP_0184708540 /NCGR_PEP_ID=MMETSP0313-20130426/37831_1 /TAXON_ID=2792 /ORGANISM="Porphyridium aerugineum, Strain SAG 1380-2" /LENGTH=109 /DNA_ID=CAMNT_0027170135 /DNA_START=480 /DNA_END=809 /DNA_ORIENTATION=+
MASDRQSDYHEDRIAMMEDSESAQPMSEEDRQILLMQNANRMAILHAELDRLLKLPSESRYAAHRKLVTERCLAILEQSTALLNQAGASASKASELELELGSLMSQLRL